MHRKRDMGIYLAIGNFSRVCLVNSNEDFEILLSISCCPVKFQDLLM